MKKRLRPFLTRKRALGTFVLCTLALLLFLGAGLTVWVFWDLPDVAPLKERRATLHIEVPDWQGNLHPLRVGPQNPHWTPLEALPAELKWAVIVAEDANFYEHKGIDVAALREAIEHDLKRRRLERGASTITQQLAKNLFLSRDKTLRRKLREMVLARRMEQELSKGRILELYLNVVELGPLVYGVGNGAQHHFGKPASALTPAESAFLAAMLPGPRVAFNPETRAPRVRQRAAHILNLLGRRHLLTEEAIVSGLTQLGRLGGRRLSQRVAPPAAAEGGDGLDSKGVFASS